MLTAKGGLNALCINKALGEAHVDFYPLIPKLTLLKKRDTETVPRTDKSMAL